MKPSLTLGLDELLTNPRYAKALTALRDMAPSAFLDQADAAHAEVDGLRSVIATAMTPEKFRAGYAEAGDYPDWLRLGALDALAGWITGESSTCRHSPDPLRPQPLMACAWKPGLVVCVRCPHLLANRRGSVADKTCDGCGHECAGPEAGDGVFPGLLQVGVLIYEFGTCTSCHEGIPTVTPA